MNRLLLSLLMLLMGIAPLGAHKNTKEKVTDFTIGDTPQVRAANATLQVKTKLTRVKGREMMDSGLTEDGYNLTFEFPLHPADCPYEVTICFWREKDPAHPLYKDGVIEDFRMMDLMQFTQSTKDSTIIGATWHKESDYEMVSEYVLNKTSWTTFSIYLPDALFESFGRPEMPAGVNSLSVRNYITYHLTFSGGTVSNEKHALPWVEQIYNRPYEQQIAHVGTEDIGDLFGEDPTPETRQGCNHNFQLRHDRRMYAHALPTPHEPEGRKGKGLPAHHIHYYYLHYTPMCRIIPQELSVERDTLPDEFTFEAQGHRSLFVRNADDCHISKSVAVEGLWAAMFPEKEVSRGHSTKDQTPLRHFSPGEAWELVNRMNVYAEEKGLKWIFTVATVNEAKHAGLDYVESDDEDAEAFTTDSCFYITAQSTLPATVKRTYITYRVITSHTANCVFPGCDYVEPEEKRYAHRDIERWGHRLCEQNEQWCARRNKETDANMSKLMADILNGKDDDSAKTQPRFIWYVEDTPYRECIHCHKRQPVAEESTIQQFTTKKEAQKYLDSLR